MRTLMRSGSRLAFVLALGLVPLSSCSSDPKPASNITQTGTLGLPLQTVGASGAVYRLRNAFFEIIDARTGQFETFLFSEDAPEETMELKKVLETGNYTVQLLDGWFIERIDGVSGSGGSGGSAGSSTAGEAGDFGSVGGFPAGGAPGFPGGAGSDDDDDPGFGGDFGVGGEIGSSGVGNEGGTFSTAGKGGTGKGGSPGKGGTGGTGSTGGSGRRVEAQLVSDAIQFFSIFGFEDSFVNFTFHVGEEELDFDHGRLRISISVIEGEEFCTPPEDFLDPGRVLLESNLEAVNSLSLFDVFSALANSEGHEGDPEHLFNQIYDSYASLENSQIPDAVHCGDETTNGEPSLNGFPIQCDRNEIVHVNDLSSFFPLAFVNRIDLAAANGSHCGQQRTIFASNSFNRAFMILEAQIPNPSPELGVEGCAPLAQFWAEQNQIDDPSERGARLAAAFVFGAPELLSAGFGPFYTASNLTVGSGQIRTNQFDTDPWTLREFKLGLNAEDQVKAIPFPVAESPNGGLWDENLDLPQGEDCRQNFIEAIGGLATNDLEQMSFIVDEACKDAESRNDGTQDYVSRMSDGFREQLDEAGAEFGLSAEDIANRAQFSGSCIGCHEESFGRFLGQGVFAPFSNSFTHVEESTEDCGGFDEGRDCFRTSQALDQAFLPSRMQVLAGMLGVPVVINPCDDDGGSGGGSSVGGSSGKGGPSPGVGGFFGAGGVSTAGSFSMGGAVGEPLPGPNPGPAPEVLIELPSADEPIEDLQEQDAEIREAYGEETLSGKSAKATH